AGHGRHGRDRAALRRPGRPPVRRAAPPAWSDEYRDSLIRRLFLSGSGSFLLRNVRTRGKVLSVTMYDGINSDAATIAKDFPNAAIVAGYVNGAYKWSTADWDRFPHATHVQITITASANTGDVLDVEAGDASPSQTAGWIKLRKSAGYHRPTIY